MCKFCEEFERAVFAPVIGEWTCIYSVKYTKNIAMDGKIISAAIRYAEDGGKFPLNYCPECGKKLLGGDLETDFTTE